MEQLERLGVEQLVLLPFDRELASLSPQQFVEDVLVKQLRPVCISVGQDFRFGHGRTGTATDLKAIAADFGIEVHITPLALCQEERISSSAIRKALAEGDMEKANRLLGRSYLLTGKVITGQQLGRTLGFPTANLELPPNKFLPRYGVYAVRVAIAEEESSIVSRHWGVMNIGCRPTLDGAKPSVEVHLLDWSGDLYEKTLTVKLEKFLRSEQKFPSLDALKSQIALDCEAARKIQMKTI